MERAASVKTQQQQPASAVARYSWEREKKRREKKIVYTHNRDRATEGCDKASLNQVGHYFEFFSPTFFQETPKKPIKQKQTNSGAERKWQISHSSVKPKKNDLLLNSFLVILANKTKLHSRDN